jgi:hypothetical protein
MHIKKFSGSKKTPKSRLAMAAKAQFTISK